MPNGDNGPYLSAKHLSKEERLRFEHMKKSPVKVLQIGEGNFLRGFVDWMLHECVKRGLFHGSVAVTQPRPSGKANIDAINRQDGLYTLVVRGRENGELVERKQVVSVFSRALDPYDNWREFIALAESPDLRFVISNTTEAGIAYVLETYSEGQPLQSFPGKLTAFLYHRFLYVKGAPDQGLIMLPCELLERNGDQLKEIVLQHSRHWGLPAEFIRWLNEHNRFLNSLVDRIVTGYPHDEAVEWFNAWGYQDALLDTAEPFYFWAIEAEPELDQELPLSQAGLNVHWVRDLKPYQQRKVRILNGAHTLLAPLGILHGLSFVREAMQDAEMRPFIEDCVLQEIIPTLPYPPTELQGYAETVFERFLNPYIRHRLADIAMNSVSKYKVRLLPSLKFYADRKTQLPEGLVRGLAGLIRFLRVRRFEDRYEGMDFQGRIYTVQDDSKVLELIAQLWTEGERRGEALEQTLQRLLGASEIWGNDLSEWNGLLPAICMHLREWERQGA